MFLTAYEYIVKQMSGESLPEPFLALAIVPFKGIPMRLIFKP